MTNPVRAVAIDAAQAIEVAAESVLVTMANLDRPGPTIVYVNSAFERMTGWRRSEVLGKTPRVLQGPETDLSIFSDLRQRLSSERLWEGRAVNYRRDGTPFVMEWSIVPLYGPSGAVEQYLAVQRDVTERVEADRARTNLSRYFSPQLVKLLETRDEPLGLGHRQDVAVLFIDIIGFTPMAESMAPEQLIKLLRSFYQRMERVIFSHNGAIQGYMGDAILATFGVPETSGRDAIDSLACGRAMLGEVARWNQKRASAGIFPVGVGIGIHCGPAVIGDVGSERCMAFTIIGDTVNVAKRLEQLTRKLGCSLAVSNDVVRAVRRRAVPREAAQLLANLRDSGPCQIHGRSRRVRVWVLDRRA